MSSSIDDPGDYADLVHRQADPAAAQAFALLAIAAAVNRLADALNVQNDLLAAAQID